MLHLPHLQRVVDNIKVEQVRLLAPASRHTVTMEPGLYLTIYCLPNLQSFLCKFPPGLTHALWTSMHKGPLKNLSTRLPESSWNLHPQSRYPQRSASNGTTQPNCAPNLAENFQVGEPSTVTAPRILHVTKQKPGKI